MKGKLFLVCFMNFFGRIKNKVRQGVEHLKGSPLFRRKSKEPEEDESLRITDVDIAVAKIKSQKRKINDRIRKVGICILIPSRLKENRQHI